MLTYAKAIDYIASQMPKMASYEAKLLMEMVADTFGKSLEEVEADVLYKLQGA